MRDEEILAMLEARNEDAITHLTDAYSKLMRQIAGNILRSGEEAEECVSDALLKIWNTIPPAKPESLRSYAAMVVRGLAVNRYNRLHAEKRGHPTTPLDELCDILPASETPEERITAQELADSVNAFLAELDRESRILFLRRYWYCDSVADLAAKMQIRENALAVRLFRIRKKLKQYLERSNLL